MVDNRSAASAGPMNPEGPVDLLGDSVKRKPGRSFGNPHHYCGSAWLPFGWLNQQTPAISLYIMNAI